jgi:hypothetical protein
VTAKDSSSSGFFVFGQKVQKLIRTLVDNCFKLLNHSERRLWWMNLARMMRPQCQKI